MMHTMDLDSKSRWEYLEYETGYERLHPKREIWAYMESQGWTYTEHWGCDIGPFGDYTLWFGDDEIWMAFRMRWS